jgi:hypothetical protein
MTGDRDRPVALPLRADRGPSRVRDSEQALSWDHIDALEKRIAFLEGQQGALFEALQKLEPALQQMVRGSQLIVSAFR